MEVENHRLLRTSIPRNVELLNKSKQSASSRVRHSDRAGAKFRATCFVVSNQVRNCTMV